MHPHVNFTLDLSSSSMGRKVMGQWIFHRQNFIKGKCDLHSYKYDSVRQHLYGNSILRLTLSLQSSKHKSIITFNVSIDIVGWLLHLSSLGSVLGIFYLVINKGEELLKPVTGSRHLLVAGRVLVIWWRKLDKLAYHDDEVYEESQETRHSTYEKQAPEAAKMKPF